jgi:hypothetical protein
MSIFLTRSFWIASYAFVCLFLRIKPIYLTARGNGPALFWELFCDGGGGGGERGSELIV